MNRVIDKMTCRKIICLCGSVRFKQEYEYFNAFFSCRGYIVLSVGCYGQDYNNEPLTKNLKKELDKLHKEKIKISDEVLIINKNGYIGKSTKRELTYAIKLKKKIFYMDDPGGIK